LTGRGRLESQRADLLVGQRETRWLDCKGQPYADSEEGRYELAKDVSAFANGGSDAVIIIGIQTRKSGGADVISRVSGIPRDDRLPDRYRKLLDYRVFPRLVGLRIGNVEYRSGRCMTVIAIPAQPPALRPFLVKGVLRDGKIEGSYVAIFVRRGDATVETGAEELHSLLVPVALRFGTTPTRSPAASGPRVLASTGGFVRGRSFFSRAPLRARCGRQARGGA
jgi:Putative DNA-binding domain